MPKTAMVEEEIFRFISVYTSGGWRYFSLAVGIPDVATIGAGKELVGSSLFAFDLLKDACHLWQHFSAYHGQAEDASISEIILLRILARKMLSKGGKALP